MSLNILNKILAVLENQKQKSISQIEKLSILLEEKLQLNCEIAALQFVSRSSLLQKIAIEQCNLQIIENRILATKK